MAANPDLLCRLRPAVLQVLEESPQGLSEYALISALRQLGVPLPDQGPADLVLFRTHFLVMHTLYQLQADLAASGLGLHISPLHIHLGVLSGGTRQHLEAGGEAALRDYYLDLSHYSETGAADVAALLDAFWMRFLTPARRERALTQLGLEAGASAADIRQAYRRLAARHHPDRGGDPGRFIAIRSAYEQLIGA